MKLNSLFFALSLFASASAFAGANNADLNCKSQDGLTITGNVPGDFAEFDLVIKQNGKTAHLFSTIDQSTAKVVENAEVTTVQDLKNGVWTLKSQTTAGNLETLEVYALPKTVKSQETNNGYKASFTGNATFYLHELNDSPFTKTVSCTLNYEI